MGIKNLNQFLKKHTGHCIKEIDIKEISNTVLAVDTSIFLYKFKYSNKLLEHFIQQIFHFKKNNIELIYVFDGKPPKEKQNTLDGRKEVKDKYNNKITLLENNLVNTTGETQLTILNEINEMKRKNIFITKDDINNIKLLFDILNIKYIQCNCEADLVCADLYKKGIVNGCLSNDMDFLTFGTGILFRNYNLGDNFLKYDLQEILNSLELTYEQFIDFCILCGCDYTGKIYRLGSENAYKLIKQYNNIENILLNCCGEGKKFKLKEEFDYISSRIQFTNKYCEEIIINNMDKTHLTNDDFENICKNELFCNIHYSDKTLRSKLGLILG